MRPTVVRFIRVLVTLIAIFSGVSPAISEPEIRFTFDKGLPAAKGNPLLFPEKNWERVHSVEEGPQAGIPFPPFNKIYLDAGSATGAGGKVLAIKVTEHNAAVTTREFIKVSRDHSYQLTAYVKGKNLDRFKASILVHYYTDKKKLLLDKGAPVIVSTPSYGGTFDQWKKVSLTINRIPHGARYVKICCRVLGDGISATAWFDDLRWTERPWLEIRTLVQGNVFTETDPVELQINFAGLDPETGPATLTVTDWQGKKVGPDLTVDMSQSGKSVRLELKTFGRFTATLTTDSLVLPLPFGRILRASPEPLAYYGLALGGPDRLSPYDLELLTKLRLGPAQIDLWADGGPSARSLTNLTAAIRPIEVVGSFGALAKADQQKFSSWAGTGKNHQLFVSTVARDKKVWRDRVHASVSTSLDLVDSWMLGGPNDASFLGKRDLDLIIQEMIKAIDHDLTAPRIVLPASLDQAGLPVPASVFAVNYRVPAKTRVAQMQSALRQAAPGPRMWVTLDLTPDNAEKNPARFAQKLVAARVAGAERVFVPVRSRLIDAKGAPLSAYFVLRTIADRIGNTPYRGSLALPGGSVAHVFGRGAERVAVVWNSSGRPVSEPVWWGSKLRAEDFMGNPEKTERNKQKTTLLNITQRPILVTQLSADLIDTLMSAALVSGGIEARLENQQKKLAFTNHYDEQISGELSLAFLAEQGRYRLHRGKQKFSLRPGARFEMTFEVRPPVGEAIGDKTLTLEMTIDGKFNGESVQIPVSFQLESDIQLETEYRELEGDRVEIIARVSNPPDGEPFSLSLYFWEQDKTPRVFMIRDIPAGASASRQLVTSKSAFDHGKKIWVIAREKSGTRFANTFVERPKKD